MKQSASSYWPDVFHKLKKVPWFFCKVRNSFSFESKTQIHPQFLGCLYYCFLHFSIWWSTRASILVELCSNNFTTIFWEFAALIRILGQHQRISQSEHKTFIKTELMQIVVSQFVRAGPMIQLLGALKLESDGLYYNSTCQYM